MRPPAEGLPLRYPGEDIGRQNCYRRRMSIGAHAVEREVTLIVIESSGPKSLVTITSPPEYISDSRSPSRAGSSTISKYLISTTLRTEERSTSPSKWPPRTPPRFERLNSQPLRARTTPRQLRKYQRQCNPLIHLRSLAIVNARKTPPETPAIMRCSAG